VNGKSDLLEIVLARSPRGSLAHLLDGRQQEAQENGNDGDYYQEFNQRETRGFCASAI
jgi:hypothetical protein